MIVFLRCVAEAVAENGLKGLAEMVPGGKYAYDVAEGAYKKYRERCREDKQDKDIQKLAEAKLDDARVEMVRVAREVLAAVPIGSGAEEPSNEEITDLELYLSAIPDAVRQSLKRAEDWTGTTVPAGFALRSADDVFKMLPSRPPRFRPDAPLPGKPGWVLDRLLGMGGFGEVWFTHHIRMQALGGAVKFCFGEAARSLIHEGNLIDRVMRAGTHPNIVPLKDVHLEGHEPWLMFEYIGGGNLTDWIHQLASKTTEQRLALALSALRQLCEAVAFFHALPVPVVHRDLKPSNILLDAQGQLKITDFGIGSVTARETNREETRGGGTRGGRLLSYMRGSHTPLYSSPQQRNGADADPRDDVHALGVIAYQMFTGKLDAAPGPRAGSVLKKAGVPDDLAEVLLNCVSEELDDRPKDGGAMLALIQPELTVDLEEYERVMLQGNGAKELIIQHAAQRFPEWLAAAHAGHAGAMNLVGEVFDYGFPAKQDRAEAVTWYRRAAELGNAWAVCNLGDAYDYGRGVPQDQVEGVKWYRKAAELGNALGMNNLGYAYTHGHGVAQDQAEGVKWYRKAAELGNASAVYNLGQCFEHGDGVKKNLNEAVSWYHKAAKLGDEEAKKALKRLGASE